MISPHTPPGTKVAFVRAPVSMFYKINTTSFKEGDVVTILSIIPDHLLKSGWSVQLVEDFRLFCPSLFRRLDLPDSLTSLLNVTPVEGDLVASEADPDLLPLLPGRSSSLLHG